MTYRIDSLDLITPAVEAAITAAAGTAPPLAAEHRSALATVIDRVAGLPFTDAPLDGDRATALALRYLDEAVQCTLAHGGLRGARTGFRRHDVEGDLERVVPCARVPVNAAAAAELAETLSVPGSLAEAIVAARRAGGPFRSIADLDERVRGIGPATRRTLEHACDFDVRVRPPAAATPTAEAALHALVAHHGGGAAGLARALDAMLTATAARPHPAHVLLQPRVHAAPPAATTPARALTLLSGSDYFRRTPEAIGAAKTRVEVAMFHAALPEPTHPTAILLRSLVDAVARGVAVRVLLDRDRPIDHYNSTVINTEAGAFLTRHAVPWRFDAADRLMHSKYIVIDDDRVILGSHNWSAGSYFQMDDLSTDVLSAPLAAQLRARFDALWSSADGVP